MKVASNGLNSTHIGELKVIRLYGSFIIVKALKADMSSSAFTLKRKTIDIPPELAHFISRSDLLPTNDVGDRRIIYPTEDYNVQLLLGLDNVAFTPREINRHADRGGQLILFRSLILGMVLPSGSQRTGRESTMKFEDGQLSYRILENGS